MAKILIIDSPIKCSNISVTDLGAFCMHNSGPNRCRSYSDNFPKRCPLEEAPTNSAEGKPQEPAESAPTDAQQRKGKTKRHCHTCVERGVCNWLAVECCSPHWQRWRLASPVA